MINEIGTSFVEGSVEGSLDEELAHVEVRNGDSVLCC